QEGWRDETGLFTSPGWRAVEAAKYDELGARAGATADGAMEVGIARSVDTRVKLMLEHASSHAGALRDGHVVYADALEGVDLIVTASHRDVESLLLLRDLNEQPAFSFAFAWRVELPTGIAQVAARGDGSLAFVNHGGEAVLAMPPAYAV